MANQSFRVKNSLEVGTGVTISAGIVTATSFVGGGSQLTGVIATSSAYATIAGIATYATSSGIATYATSSGIATYATSSGIATYATSSGIATYATSAGIATYATSAGIATYATSSGIATYATSAGIATYATSSGVSTSVVGGIGSVTQLQVTGISTFTNGPVLVGTASSTGTVSQPLQVTGGAYVSGNLGIGTIDPTEKLSVVGVVSATSFYGDISNTVSGRWILGANGSSDYTFTGIGFTQTTNDPTLYLKRGEVYEFVNTMGIHPFRIQSTVNGSAGTQFNRGVTNNDVSNGILKFEVPMDSPSILYYQCTAHAGMGGIINLLDGLNTVPQNVQTSAYVLVATDSGKHISITTGGVTVPQNIFTIGDTIAIYNNSGSSQTITQGTGVTLRFAGTASTGNRTLDQYGLCTVLCVASNTFAISGSGLS